MKVTPTFTLVLALLSVACGKPTPDPAPPTPQTVSVDGHERLPRNVTPSGYTLDLTIDPAKGTFSGLTRIEIEVGEATNAIVMHAEDLEFSSAKFVRGETTLEPDVEFGEHGGIAVVFSEALDAGPATLEFEYSAPLDEVPTGLYRVEDGERWYAFTQFEPLEARQAFPAFDEPRFKTPYDVTMRVPTGHLALTNTPEVSRTTEGEWDVFTFAQSKPLPTYLVAFAVGDFDVVEAPTDAIEGVPLRLIATKGKGKLGAFMLERTPMLLQEVSEYFGTPHPYAKLDIVAVPNFSAGAMENVGLVTFRETLLLLDPETASVSQQRSAMSVMTHELAHMWFGNLVTPQWWDDLWLNESFATWMAHRVIVDVMPELEADVDAIVSVNWIIGADSRKESRMIRQPIADGGDVYNAFDAITYGKGAAILRMFETWIGTEAFREGIRDYLQANAHGTGSTQDVLDALDTASGEPVGEAMATFLDQPGAPLLTMSVDCEGDAPTLKIEQSRYLPAGSDADQTGPWQVPFCVSYSDGEEKTYCDLLVEPAGSFTLGDAEGCPKWFYPNAGQDGYYRWSTGDDNLAALTSEEVFGRFDDPAKVEIFTDIDALSRAEEITADRWFQTVDQMGAEKHRTIVRQVIRALWNVDRVIPESDREKFEQKVEELLRPHLDRVGYESAADEPTERSLLRPYLVKASAFLAGDDDALEMARTTTKRFMSDMDSVRSDMVGLSLPIAAWNGDASLWLSYKLAIDKAPTPAARSAVIRGLGSFRDPELLGRSLDLFLDDTLRAQDMWTLIAPTFETDETFAVTWAWFTTNYDAIVELVGHKAIGRLPRVGRGFCDTDGPAKVEAFFSDESRRGPGIERNLANTLESIDQCMRRRAYYESGLKTLLE